MGSLPFPSISPTFSMALWGLMCHGVYCTGRELFCLLTLYINNPFTLQHQHMLVLFAQFNPNTIGYYKHNPLHLTSGSVHSVQRNANRIQLRYSKTGTLV